MLKLLIGFVFGLMVATASAACYYSLMIAPQEKPCLGGVYIPD